MTLRLETTNPPPPETATEEPLWRRTRRYEDLPDWLDMEDAAIYAGFGRSAAPIQEILTQQKVQVAHGITPANPLLCIRRKHTNRIHKESLQRYLKGEEGL